MQKWRPFLHLYTTIPSPYHSRDSMGRKRAEAKRERETKERKRGRGEERDGTKAAPQPQSAKISPKGRKTSRVNTRENAELLNLGVNQEGPTFHITTNNAAASDACDTHQRHTIPPTLGMHRIRLKSHLLFQLFSI